MHLAATALVSFLMTPPPPRSPLLPYTTLFRSTAGADLVLLIVAALDDDRLRRLHDEARELGLAVDRKSTRLNSSHPSISYAVFCLKKKKRQTAMDLAANGVGAVDWTATLTTKL